MDSIELREGDGEESTGGVELHSTGTLREEEEEER